MDAIKSFTRMHSWLHSFDDHWTKPVPRPAENADVVRCTAVFDGAEKLAAAAKQLQKAFGPLATFHNGMAASKEEALAVSGVRTVLMGACQICYFSPGRSCPAGSHVACFDCCCILTQG